MIAPLVRLDMVPEGAAICFPYSGRRAVVVGHGDSGSRVRMLSGEERGQVIRVSGGCDVLPAFVPDEVSSTSDGNDD
jgi:hypothetical protein